MRVHNVEIEIIAGDGEHIEADAVALESVESFNVPGGEQLFVRKGTNNTTTILADISFTQTEDDVERVRLGYVDVFNKVAELKIQRLIIIPFGYEKGVITPEASAKVLAQELLRFVRFAKHSLQELSICVTDLEHFAVFEQNILGYLTHIQDTLGMGPYVTVDAIVERPDGIVIIERSNPPYGWALPGGFVDYGESVEQAVVRETREETGLELKDFYQFKVCSAPGRDPRFHTVSIVFVGRGDGDPQASDDAKALKVVADEELLTQDYAFDHKQVIQEYLEQKGS